jgi:anthranilate phosphoribosyltransferase
LLNPYKIIAEENAVKLRFTSKDEKGAKRNPSVLNAAAMLCVRGGIRTIDEAPRATEQTINSRRAIKKFDEFTRSSSTR